MPNIKLLKDNTGENPDDLEFNVYVFYSTSFHSIPFSLLHSFCLMLAGILWVEPGPWE